MTGDHRDRIRMDMVTLTRKAIAARDLLRLTEIVGERATFEGWGDKAKVDYLRACAGMIEAKGNAP